MDQESPAQIRQIVNTAAETLRVEIVDAKRHTGVLTEGLRHEFQLVAKGSRCISTGVIPMIERIWTRNSEKPARFSFYPPQQGDQPVLHCRVSAIAAETPMNNRHWLAQEPVRH